MQKAEGERAPLHLSLQGRVVPDGVVTGGTTSIHKQAAAPLLLSLSVKLQSQHTLDTGHPPHCPHSQSLLEECPLGLPETPYLTLPHLHDASFLCTHASGPSVEQGHTQAGPGRSLDPTLLLGEQTVAQSPLGGDPSNEQGAYVWNDMNYLVLGIDSHRVRFGENRRK